MRELKFRVWNGKEMTYPKTVEVGINPWNNLTSASYQLDNGGYCTSTYVMQYVGLKDITGKEVYEGDIIAYYNTLWTKYIKDNTYREYATVTYLKDTTLYPFQEHVDYDGAHFTDMYTWEVIGNIYENPELIKLEDIKTI